MTNKITGFILVFLGIAIILYGIYSSYNIFTGKILPPQIFASVSIQNQQTNGNDLQSQIQDIVSSQIKGLIPSDYLSKIFNLASWSIFMGIIIWAGAQIAGLGIKLIK